MALVGRDPDRTRERARQFDVPLALTSLDDALALDGVDAVTIATPPHTHAELALARDRGGQARDLREAVRARCAGRRGACSPPPEPPASCTCSAPSSAGMPGRRRSLARVRSGAIGEPRLATVLLHVPVLADPDAEVPDVVGRRARAAAAGSARTARR